MPRPLEALAEEVLQLPPEARVRLLDRVVASLDADRARDAAWDALAGARQVELESGQIERLLIADVVAQLKARSE